MNSTSFELTMEQEFHLRLMQETIQQMNRDQMQDLLIQSARLLFVKDNVIKDLVKSCVL